MLLAPSRAAEDAASLTYRCREGVAAEHQPLHDEIARSVANEAVPLHLSQTEPAIPAAALGGLAREHRARSAGPGVHLVHDHVLELLVENRPHEDVGADLLARGPAGEDVLPVVVEAMAHELLRGHLDAVCVAILFAERGPVRLSPAQHPRLAGEKLDHLPDGHPRREPVRIHDQVRACAFFVERHVLLRHNDPADSLLAVPRAELVSHLRPSALPQVDLDEELLVLIRRDHHLVDVHARGGLPRHRRWLVLRRRAALENAWLRRLLRSLLVDQNLPGLHLLAHVRKPVVVQREELAEALFVPLRCFDERRTDRPIHRAVGIAPDAGLRLLQDQATAPATVDACLVQHDGVLNVVAAVGHHGDAGVLASGNLVEVDQIQDTGRDHRLLGIHHRVQERVDPFVLVHGNRAHGLLAHRALVCVSRRLVVVGKRDQTGYHAHDGERIDLEVRVIPRQLALLQGDEAVVLLVDIHVLDDAIREEVPKLAALHHQQRAAHAASIGSDVDRTSLLMQIDADELSDAASAAKKAQAPCQVLGVRMDANDQAVHDHQVGVRAVELRAGDKTDVFHSQIKAQPSYRRLFFIVRHVSEKRQVLYQSACFSFGSIRRTVVRDESVCNERVRLARRGKIHHNWAGGRRHIVNGSNADVQHSGIKIRRRGMEELR
eukprot:scaffold641_cov237-Pinguiococcus_pyrenoidosus.AAC.17